jgi:hypothetical protein
MTITIKKNKPLKLKLPKFNVDSKLSDYMPEPLNSVINKTNFSIFLGPPKSGKSSLLYSFFMTKDVYKKKFHHIYLVTPATSLKSVKNNVFTKHLPEDNIFYDLDTPTIMMLYDKIEQNSRDNHKSIIILDDQASHIKSVEKDLMVILYNRRHLKTTVMMTLQTLKCLNLSLRKVIDNLFVFKVSKKDFESVIEEFIEQDRHTALELMKLYKNSHDWLLINVPDKRLWINEDEVFIDDEK